MLELQLLCFRDFNLPHHIYYSDSRPTDSPRKVALNERVHKLSECQRQTLFTKIQPKV